MAVFAGGIFSGCKVSDSSVKATVLAQPMAIDSFVLMDDSSYFGRFAAALAKEGFALRPITTTAIRTEQFDPTVRRKFQEPGTRFALRVELIFAGMCVFSNSRGYDGTLTVIDLQENKTLLVLEVTGPDGECPPLTPIWDLFARALRERIPKQ